MNKQDCLCFCFKYYKQSCAIEDYNKIEYKNDVLCLSREKDASKKRIFYLVKISKFINFYTTLQNRNFYEVGTNIFCI